MIPYPEHDKIKIAGITQDSVVDGPGLRTVIFFQGCHRKCPHCHNPETHDPQKGQLMEISEILKAISSNPMTQGVTISGGEPFLQIEELCNLLSIVKKRYHTMVYTGYRWEELDDKMKEVLPFIDLLVDGSFDVEKKDISLGFRGSSNQRIINVPSSLKMDGPVITSI